MAQAPTPPPSGEADPSMDDILASIRRILSDEEKSAKAKPADDGVLTLDSSMMVEEPSATEAPAAAEHHLASPAEQHIAPPPQQEQQPETPMHDFPAMPAANFTMPPAEVEIPTEGLVAPAAAAAAATSVGTLMRTLVAERNAVVHRGGPSIEDLVREEIRPLLKAWLDAHLPSLVERLVRTEIERVVGRITG